MKRVYEEIAACLSEQCDVMMISVVADSGSTPRGAGAKMWIASDGRRGGTIGGGNVEYQAGLKGQELLIEGRSMVQDYHLGLKDVAGLGMVCGGDVVVYFQYLSGQSKSAAELMQLYAEQFGQNENAWMILDMTEDSAWQMGFYSERKGVVGLPDGDYSAVLGKKPRRQEQDGRTYYTEPVSQEGIVYIFGGGHVSQKVVPMLSSVDFTCVVLDDREELMTEELFPTAVKRIVCDFDHISDQITMKPADYAVIMTRGHKFDYQVQRQVLALKPDYIGVIGSRRKIAYVTDKLIKDGFDQSEIETCFMPIGLPIEAETPQEIAVSVTAELIQHRANKNRV